jgi:hypothetical protein
MKERQILFSAPMVCANLEGWKTQTRRIVNTLRGFGHITEFNKSDTSGYEWQFRDKRCLWNDISNERLFECCPYGQPGDQLWVRETCRAEELLSGLDGVRYLADNRFRPIENSRAASEQWMVLNSYRKKRGATVPPIHMPRWASRIDLEITVIRVERLQDISEQDAMAEGIENVGGKFSCSPWRNYRISKPGEMNMHCASPQRSYMTLWESINSAGSWNINPWVWVIEFKKI